MTYQELKQLIDAFRAETQPDSITPDTLGQLLDKIAQFSEDKDPGSKIEEGLQDIADALTDALEDINEGKTTAESVIASAKTEALEEITAATAGVDEAKEEALEEIEEAIQNLDITYETISGDNVQLKNGGGDLLMPKTDARNVTIPNGKIVYGDGDTLSALEEITGKFLEEKDLVINTGYPTSGATVRINSTTLKWEHATASYGQVTYIGEYKGCYLKIVGSDIGANFAFLKNGTGIQDGNSVNYCDGTSLLQLYANSTIIVRIPDDCEYVYFYCKVSAGYNYPSSIKVYAEKGEQSDDFPTVEVKVKFSDYELIQNIIGNALVWNESDAVSHYLIPLEDVTAVKFKGTSDSIILFLNNDEITGRPSLCAKNYTSRINGNNAEQIFFVNDEKYLYVRAFSGTSDYRPEYIILRKKLRGITKDEAKFIQNAMFEEYAYSYGNPLVILQATDIHGSLTASKKYVEIYNALKEIVDVPIHTGDAMQSIFTSDWTYWNTAGMGFVLNTIGNHDSASNTVGTGWTGKSRADVYDRYIAPYVSGWNVVQPTGVDDSTSPYYKTCYYYKDFADKRIRLVSFDCMYHDTDEDTWFENVLADAKTNGLAVAVFSHYQCGNIASEYQKTGLASFTYKNAVMEEPLKLNDEPARIISEFIENGGTFLAWISGHRHVDDLGWLSAEGRTDIFSIVLEKSSSNKGSTIEDNYRTHDAIRQYGEHNAYSFNLIFLSAQDYNQSTGNFAHRKVKVIRLGNRQDMNLRRKEQVSVEVRPAYKAVVTPV